MATLLSAGCSFRKHYTFFPPRLSVGEAKAQGVALDATARTQFLISGPKPKRRRARSHYVTGLVTPPPAASWAEPDLDDSSWLRATGVEFTGIHAASPRSAPGSSASPLPAAHPDRMPYVRGTDPFAEEVGLICMRGRFIVKRKSGAKKLSLSLTYRGGFVAYLNGTEIARGSLPDGKLQPDTPAADYALDAFVGPDGKPALNEHLHLGKDREKLEPHWAMRERKSGPLEIGLRHLRNGVNVLAIELHRSDYPAGCRETGMCFSTAGLAELVLQAETPADNIVTSLHRPSALQVWTEPAWRSVWTTDFGDPAEPLRPIRLAAARNGCFSALALAGSTQPIKSLRVQVSALQAARGQAEIPKEAVTVRFGAPNPTYLGKFCWTNGLVRRRFDMLIERAPATFDLPPLEQPAEAFKGWSPLVRQALGLPTEPVRGITVPIWVSVRTPKTVAPGDYRGMLTISASGSEPVSVPMEFQLADWSLPDLKDYASLLFLYQSPDTLAQYYKVPLWSDAHWRLIEKSLALLGRIGNIGLILPLRAKTELGNAESMVQWVKQQDGTWRHDFAIFERYLDTALKYHDADRLKCIAMDVWGAEVAREGRSAEVTVVDPATGEKTVMALPPYGSPECEELWEPVIMGVFERLEKMGLERKMMFGTPSDDSDPDPAHIAMFENILPGTPWLREAHFDKKALKCDPTDRTRTVPVGINSIIWGKAMPDPAVKRLYGWRHDPSHLVLNFNRFGNPSMNLYGFQEPWYFRIWMEGTLACGRNGNGRVGADYFKLRPMADDSNGGLGWRRAPETRFRMGHTGLNVNTTDLLAAGPDGPAATMRYENALEGNQEAEARVFIERALLDVKKPLPERLAKQCQELLDARLNAIRMRRVGYVAAWSSHRHGRVDLGSLTWREENQALFGLAAKVAKTRR